jgi:hypothetical protein
MSSLPCHVAESNESFIDLGAFRVYSGVWVTTISCGQAPAHIVETFPESRPALLSNAASSERRLPRLCAVNATVDAATRRDEPTYHSAYQPSGSRGDRELAFEDARSNLPGLLKIEEEGYECSVSAGAAEALSRGDTSALFELRSNPPQVGRRSATGRWC